MGVVFGLVGFLFECLNCLFSWRMDICEGNNNLDCFEEIKRDSCFILSKLLYTSLSGS